MNHLTHRSGFLQMLMSVALCLCVFGADAASGIVKAGSSPVGSVNKLSVPTPRASKKQNAYVKLSWKKVSGAEGYYIFRGTSTSWKDASYLAKITSRFTNDYYDHSATPGVKYRYWVCPYASGYYYNNTKKYATGVRKAQSTPTTPTTPTTPVSPSGFYFSDYSGSRLGTSISLAVGATRTICLRNSSGQAVGASWYKSNSNLSDNRTSATESVLYLQIRGMAAGTTTLTAMHNGNSYTLSVTIGSGMSGNGYRISGSSSVRYGSSARYSLYRNGQKVTGVTWSVGAYLRKVSVSAGTLTVTPLTRPVTSNSSAIYAYVNGSRVASMGVRVTR